MNSKPITPKTYFAVWFILMVLLVLTWGVSEFDLGVFSVVAALSIAVVKMVLVILYFMHVRDSSRLTRLFVGAGFFWLLINISLTLSDYTTRKIDPHLLGHTMPDLKQGIPNHLPGGKQDGAPAGNR